MNAIQTPAQAVTEGGGPLGLAWRDWARVAGGMTFASGALVLLIRKQSDWSEWAVFAGLLIPAAVLIGIAVAGHLGGDAGQWRVPFLVFGTLLLLAALNQLVDALKGDPSTDLNLVWTFGVSGAVAVVTSLALRAQYQMLIGATLLIVSWLALWDKVLSNPSGDTVRWLLVVIAAIYLAAAVALARRGRPQASDLITVSGAAAVLAAAASFAAAAGALGDTLGRSSFGSGAPGPGQGWNVFLLVVALLLIAYSSRSPTRGPGYVGAVGLGAFVLLTGIDLVNRLKGEGGGVAGWPLVLLIGGAALIALSFVLRPGAGGPGAAPPPGPGGPGATQLGGPVPGRPGVPPQPQQPGGPPPGAPPPQPPQPGAPPPQPGQAGGLLDQWRGQPPPTGGAPPQQ